MSDSSESDSSSNKVSVKDMPKYCIGEASAKFGMKPTYFTTQDAVKDQGMYSVWGQYDDEPSPQVFICTFTGDGEFVGVDNN